VSGQKNRRLSGQKTDAYQLCLARFSSKLKLDPIYVNIEFVWAVFGDKDAAEEAAKSPSIYIQTKANVLTAIQTL